MATGVNVKMGVSGVQQFKQGMKESQQAVKTLDQALKLNEQQLKSTGDAELYLQNKTQILQDQIEKQTQVVKQSEAALNAMRKNGVSETSTAFQQMQANVYKASSDLMRMRTELENVGESGADAAEDTRDLTANLKDIGRGVSWENVTNGIEKITGSLEAAAKAAFRMGRAIVSATLEGGQWADELQTTADQWEIDPEQLYRMRQTANLIDTDAETIFQARKKLTAAMGKEGNKETMGAFAALGIDPNTRHGDIESVFWEAGEALMGMEDKVDRNEYAMRLFGRSFEDLIPLFKTGREAYEETMDSWTWIGDEQFENLKKVDDARQTLSTEWDALKLQFEATMADVMAPVMETLTGLLKEFNTYLQSDAGQEMMKSLGDTISELFEDLTKIDPETVINGIKDALDGVKSALNWIKTNKQGIKKAIEAIALAWGAMKLGGLALNIGKIVSGFKQLGWIGGGGAATAATPAATSAAGSSTGGGFLGGLINTLTLAAGADAVWKATDGKIKELNREFNEKTAGMTPMEAADFALFHDLGITREQLNHWGDSHENEDPMSWTGRGHSFGEPEPEPESWLPAISPFAENLQDYYAEPIDRMTEVAGETTEAVTQSTAATAMMTSAVKGFETMPELLRAAVESAVRSGMSGVTIVINESAVDAMVPRIGRNMRNQAVNMLR